MQITMFQFGGWKFCFLPLPMTITSNYASKYFMLYSESMASLKQSGYLTWIAFCFGMLCHAFAWHWHVITRKLKSYLSKASQFLYVPIAWKEWSLTTEAFLRGNNNLCLSWACIISFQITYKVIVGKSFNNNI